MLANVCFETRTLGIRVNDERTTNYIHVYRKFVVLYKFDNYRSLASLIYQLPREPDSTSGRRDERKANIYFAT